MTSARTARVGLEYGYRAGNMQQELGLWSWPIQMMQTVWEQLCSQHLRARARWNSGVPWAFPVPGAEGRRAVQSKELSLLPLLHALHLQAEGGEAGQEVCHFIHLQRETQTELGITTQQRHCFSSGHTDASPSWCSNDEDGG